MLNRARIRHESKFFYLILFFVCKSILDVHVYWITPDIRFYIYKIVVIYCITITEHKHEDCTRKWWHNIKTSVNLHCYSMLFLSSKRLKHYRCLEKMQSHLNRRLRFFYQLLMVTLTMTTTTTLMMVMIEMIIVKMMMIKMMFMACFSFVCSDVQELGRYNWHQKLSRK